MFYFFKTLIKKILVLRNMPKDLCNRNAIHNQEQNILIRVEILSYKTAFFDYISWNI